MGELGEFRRLYSLPSTTFKARHSLWRTLFSSLHQSKVPPSLRTLLPSLGSCHFSSLRASSAAEQFPLLIRRPNTMHKPQEPSVLQRVPTLDSRMHSNDDEKEALLQETATELGAVEIHSRVPCLDPRMQSKADKKEALPQRRVTELEGAVKIAPRVPTLDPRAHIKAYEKEALLQRRAVELEEEAAKIDLDPGKLLKQGDPSSVQAVVKEILPVGLFLSMPNGKEGFLPSTDFGFSGGVVILRSLFTVGQVLTVKVLRSGGGGREIVSMRKPEPVEA